MQRLATDFLEDWLTKKQAKPLVIYGAPQVGKTWIVREAVQQQNKHFIEFSVLEKYGMTSWFSSGDSEKILSKLGIDLTVHDLSHTILFIDDLEVVPDWFSNVIDFVQQFSELSVIIAGFPVLHTKAIEEGLDSLFIGPLSFEEFLMAMGETELLAIIKSYEWDSVISQDEHAALMKLVYEYKIIGGMPCAVMRWTIGQSLARVSRELTRIMRDFKRNYGAYNGNWDTSIFSRVADGVPRYLGKRVAYKKIHPDVKACEVKENVAKLCRVGLCQTIRDIEHSGSDKEQPYFKALFLDSGLSLSGLGFSHIHAGAIHTLKLANEWGLMCQFVGQQLCALQPDKEPQLYYGCASEDDIIADVDYVIRNRDTSIPIKVKSGASRSLKALHMFMHLKKLPLAVRINTRLPVKFDVQTSVNGESVSYELRSIPFYLVSELYRLLEF